MPQKPDFSSPNSTDADKQQIAAAAASMTESDPKQAITSSSSDNNAPARGMFGNRRFKAKKDATPTSFAGAPDFFNQAAGGNSQDFVTVSDAPVKRSGNKTRIVIIVVLVAAIAIVGLVAAFMPKITHDVQAANKQKASNRIANILISGEDKEDEVGIDRNVISSHYDQYHIYSEANSESGCSDMINKIGGISKSFKEFSDLTKELQNLCDDMSLQEVDFQTIIEESDNLTRRDMSAYVDEYYTLSNRYSKAQEIRREQAYANMDLVEILVSNGCVGEDRAINLLCWSGVEQNEAYISKNAEYYEFGNKYKEEITQEFRAILKKLIKKEEEKDVEK